MDSLPFLHWTTICQCLQVVRSWIIYSAGAAPLIATLTHRQRAYACPHVPSYSQRRRQTTSSTISLGSSAPFSQPMQNPFPIRQSSSPVPRASHVNRVWKEAFLGLGNSEENLANTGFARWFSACSCIARFNDRSARLNDKKHTQDTHNFVR